jgi:hypothetical protein
MQLLHGTDTRTPAQMIEASKVLDHETRRAINRENAVALFPRLAREAAAA